jgi:thiamine biosynthesis lipoprotein
MRLVTLHSQVVASNHSNISHSVRTILITCLQGRLITFVLLTSGDRYRHIAAEAVRYGHVLDARTGWPIADAPRSVTVHARSCSEAGLLAKLALLHGPDAEEFLRIEQVRAWCYR